jgi:hypothetical protein
MDPPFSSTGTMMFVYKTASLTVAVSLLLDLLMMLLRRQRRSLKPLIVLFLRFFHCSRDIPSEESRQKKCPMMVTHREGDRIRVTDGRHFSQKKGKGEGDLFARSTPAERGGGGGGEGGNEVNTDVSISPTPQNVVIAG